MKVKVGDKVIKGYFDSHFVLEVVSRTNRSVATRFLNGSPCDQRAPLRHFRLYDADKVAQLDQLEEEMTARGNEYLKIYKSLEPVE